MVEAEKLGMVKTLLRIDDTSEDALIRTYLLAAKKEILSWRYSLADDTPDEVPTEYEMTQVWAVIYGYSQSGAEGEKTHIENGIHRHFSYEDMVSYIHQNVIHIAKVV